MIDTCLFSVLYDKNVKTEQLTENFPRPDIAAAIAAAIPCGPLLIPFLPAALANMSIDTWPS